ncbi:MAG: hypothetical protein M1816_001722 [Peltula sp. TS41687]|nr:MAG: hypothetical protein M1816_001722 [Peltula sp. TS41687]
MRAYLICRNFSVNDGMYPAGHKGEGGVIQGLPVAIGTGRHSRYDSGSSGGGGGGGGAGYISGGSSPRSSDSGREEVVRHASRLSRTLGYGSREWVIIRSRLGCFLIEGYGGAQDGKGMTDDVTNLRLLLPLGLS